MLELQLQIIFYTYLYPYSIVSNDYSLGYGNNLDAQLCDQVTS